LPTGCPSCCARRRTAPVAVAFAGLLAALALAAAAAGSPRLGRQPESPRQSLVGATLEEALARLAAEGVLVVYSSRLVRPDMTVESEPRGDTALERLTDLLAPFGLAVRSAPGERFVVVRDAAGLSGSVVVAVRDRRSRDPIAGARVAVGGTVATAVTGADGRVELAALPSGVYAVEVEARGYPPTSASARVRPGQRVSLRFELEVPVVPLEEIVVTPSRVEIARREPQAVTELEREAVLAAPSPGDDVFRATSSVPGVARSDLSAQFNLRGGRPDEVLVELDGVELYEPYHLRDLGSALSIVPPPAVDSLEIRSGGFSAAHGDRMSGLLSIETVRPTRRLQGHLGLSLVDASAGLGGVFAKERARWLLVGRRGVLDQVFELARDDDRPEFWDLFGKIDLQASTGHAVRLEAVRSEDELALERDGERSLARYSNDYLWGGHQAILGRATLVDTLGWAGRFDRDRTAAGDDAQRVFDLRDRRFVDLLGIKQDWSRQLGPRQSLRWGAAVRHIRSSYRYAGQVTSLDPLGALRTNGPITGLEADQVLRGRQDAVYTSYRRQLGDDVTVELGARFDENRLIDDERVSPRLNLAWAVGERGVFRLGLGEFTQSQRPHELDVGDGVLTLAQDERARQAAVGYERFVGRRLSLRVEAYHRSVADPRVRWENLFDPLSLAPEAGLDRVRLEPSETRSSGFELFVRRELGERFGWSVSYAWSSVEDRIDDSWVPRAIDQPHALNLGADLRLGERWRLHADWSGHTGWPTTGLSARVVEQDGEPVVVPVLGPLHAERLPDFHRLDLRLSREQTLRHGVLTVFADLLNAYDRKNVRGYEIELSTAGPAPTVGREPLLWTRRLASIGVRWEF
jgi:hypothetical protein